jgi:hypothetical protein
MEVISMDELVKLVVKKTGLPEAQAKQVVEIVIGFLKGKLPAPIAGQIDGVLASGAAGNVAQGLGGLFGKKKG